MVDTHQHHDPDGPADDEAARRLDILGERVESPGMVVLDRARLKRIMRKHDSAVYPGRFVTCVHDHTKAVCAKARTGGSEGLPDHGGCRPLHCANVALTAENRGEWETQLVNVEARLTAPLPPPPLLERVLRQRQAEITNFLGCTTKDTRCVRRPTCPAPPS